MWNVFGLKITLKAFTSSLPMILNEMYGRNSSEISLFPLCISSNAPISLWQNEFNIDKVLLYYYVLELVLDSVWYRGWYLNVWKRVFNMDICIWLPVVWLLLQAIIVFWCNWMVYKCIYIDIIITYYLPSSYGFWILGLVI